MLPVDIAACLVSQEQDRPRRTRSRVIAVEHTLTCGNVKGVNVEMQ